LSEKIHGWILLSNASHEECEKERRDIEEKRKAKRKKR